MKVIPSNQTLLLASEQSPRVLKDATPLDRALSAASSGGVLKRLTIVSAEPDASLVYVHADYASGTDEAQADTGPGAYLPPARTRTRISDTSVPASSTSSSGLIPASGAGGTLVLYDGNQLRALRDDYGNLRTASRDALSSSLKPTEQYARTQRILSDIALPTRIDVRV